MLVVSSHALDFLWRAGGTIAKYKQKNWEIKIICLTYGERGESGEIWVNNPGISETKVKEIREDEAKKASQILGVQSIEFYDFVDHPLTFDKERILKMATAIKEYKPQIILTQFDCDVLNPDHPETANAVFKALRCATVDGVYPEISKAPFPAIFWYDPSQPEFFNFNPDTFIDITEEIETKKKAMMVTNAQKYLIDIYIDRAKSRADIARRFSGKREIQYAEAFVRVFPQVGKEFN